MYQRIGYCNVAIHKFCLPLTGLLLELLLEVAINCHIAYSTTQLYIII